MTRGLLSDGLPRESSAVSVRQLGARGAIGGGPSQATAVESRRSHALSGRADGRTPVVPHVPQTCGRRVMRSHSWRCVGKSPRRARGRSELRFFMEGEMERVDRVTLTRREMLRLSAAGAGVFMLTASGMAVSSAISVSDGGGKLYIEAFPTCRLILKPFDEPLPIPQAVAPVPKTV